MIASSTFIPGFRTDGVYTIIHIRGEWAMEMWKGGAVYRYQTQRMVALKFYTLQRCPAHRFRYSDIGLEGALEMQFRAIPYVSFRLICP